MSERSPSAGIKNYFNFPAPKINDFKSKLLHAENLNLHRIRKASKSKSKKEPLKPTAADYNSVEMGKFSGNKF